MLKKGRILTLWIAFAGFAYVCASQDWYTLSMSPNGDTVKLSSYDGLTSYSNLSALLMLNFAAILAIAFVGLWGRRITAWLLAALNAFTLVWILTRIQKQDISGLSKQVEQMTGIAAAHGIDNVTVTTQNSALFFAAGLAATLLASLGVALTSQRWPKRVSKTELPSKSPKDTEPDDAIGIWDSQRR
jgi:uncharacterized membrane protein (TIGR02234 family)